MNLKTQQIVLALKSTNLGNMSVIDGCTCVPNFFTEDQEDRVLIAIKTFLETMKAEVIIAQKTNNEKLTEAVSTTFECFDQKQ